MGEIMNSAKGVKSGVPERVSISCPTYGTVHESHKVTRNQSYVAVVEQTIHLVLLSTTNLLACNIVISGSIPV